MSEENRNMKYEQIDCGTRVDIQTYNRSFSWPWTRLWSHLWIIEGEVNISCSYHDTVECKHIHTCQYRQTVRIVPKNCEPGGSSLDTYYGNIWQKHLTVSSVSSELHLCFSSCFWSLSSGVFCDSRRLKSPQSPLLDTLTSSGTWIPHTAQTAEPIRNRGCEEFN